MNKQQTKPYRIAIGRFMMESNSFSPVKTTLVDFQRTHFKEGEALLKACQPREWEVEGYLKNLELSGFMKAVRKHSDKDIEVVPLFSAWAISGGPLDGQDFESMRQKLEYLLQESGELDAVFLAVHGALDVDNVLEPETVLFQTVRKICGKIPLATTMDLHGLLTKDKVESVDILCAYHSNPHWDMARTGFKAGDLLIRMLAGEVQPVSTWRSLPMVLGGGTTLSFLPPVRAIFERMKEMEKDPRVLSCSTFMLHPFLRHPDLGWSVHVITDGNQVLADELADELAERCWGVRHQKPPKFLSPSAAFEKARHLKWARRTGTITVCDTSDVVGAGAAGENTNLLQAVLNEGQDFQTYMPLRDPVTVDELWDTPIGQSANVVLGGKLHPEMNPPVVATAKLLAKKKTDYFGKMVVLDLKHLTLFVTEGAPLSLKPAFYEDMGFPVRKADLTVVKNFFHYKLYYWTKSFKSLLVKTRGVTDLDLALKVQTRDPVFPIQALSDWREIDRKRRHIVNLPFGTPPKERLKNYERHKRNQRLLVTGGFLAGIGALFFMGRRR